MTSSGEIHYPASSYYIKIQKKHFSFPLGATVLDDPAFQL